MGRTRNFVFSVGSQTVTVLVGACSGPIQLPAGPATVTEAPVEGISVTAIEASPEGRLVSTDLVSRVAQTTIVAGDVSAQATVTFTNRADVAPLKVCKVAGTGVAVGATFTFTVPGGSVSVPAGPAPGGYCVVAGSFPVAGNVAVSEQVPRGLEVGAITVGPPILTTTVAPLVLAVPTRRPRPPAGRSGRARGRQATFSAPRTGERAAHQGRGDGSGGGRR